MQHVCVTLDSYVWHCVKKLLIFYHIFDCAKLVTCGYVYVVASGRVI